MSLQRLAEKPPDRLGPGTDPLLKTEIVDLFEQSVGQPQIDLSLGILWHIHGNACIIGTNRFAVTIIIGDSSDTVNSDADQKDSP